MLRVRPSRVRLVASIMNTLESLLQSNARFRLTMRREDLPPGGWKVDTTTLIRLTVLLITVFVSPFRRRRRLGLRPF